MGRIAAHAFEPEGHTLTFTGRLARDHGWSLDEARAAIEEYRRFCFLAVSAGRGVTPSEEVDEVWHQHLTYSRDYWRNWCGEALRTELHHEPTKGGAAQGAHFAEQYAATLALYEARFGPPPPSFWPGTAERFGRRPRFRIVDRRHALVFALPGRPGHGVLRRALGLGLAVAFSALGTGPAAAASWDVLDWTAGPFLTFYAVAAVVSLLVAKDLPSVLTATPASRPRCGVLGPAEVAFLAGGRTRAADVMTLEAIASGRASLEGRTITVAGRSTTRAALKGDLSAHIDHLQDRLVEEGFALSRDRHFALRVATFGLVSPVLLIGLAKIGVGSARDKPVGILVALVLVTAFVGIVLTGERRPASRAGRRALTQYRGEHQRAIRAPRPEEVIAAFACVGISALVGTAFASYGELIKAQSNGGSGCSSGGGCGGGGCGGCGGA